MSDRILDSGWFFIAAMLGALAALFILIGTPIWIGTYYSQKASCRNFARQTNRETKFVVLVRAVAPISWDCFTRTADGKWIPTKNLRGFGEQP